MKKTPPDWTYHETRKERRPYVLSCLALTRAEFTADLKTGQSIGKGPIHLSALGTNLLPIKRSRGSILLSSPNAQTISAVLVCSVFFGPRRLLALVGLPIVRAWATRAIRDLVTAPKPQKSNELTPTDSVGATP